MRAVVWCFDLKPVGNEDISCDARKEARLKEEIVAEKMQEGKEEGGFEVVPKVKILGIDEDNADGAEKKDDDDDSDSALHLSDYDSDERAEIEAIFKKMRGLFEMFLRFSMTCQSIQLRLSWRFTALFP